MSIAENQKIISPLDILLSDEQKIRDLAIELAKDISNPADIMTALQISQEAYNAIRGTRAFKLMYEQALAEWHGAKNTPKRVRFKAAAMVESALPTFYADLKDREVSINARVDLLNLLAKFGSIGIPEPSTPGGPGQSFKLEIHLSGKDNKTIIVGSGTGDAPEPQSPLVEAADYDEL